LQLFDPEVKLAGIILNKVGSPAHAEWLVGSLKTAGCNVPVLGSIPQDLDVQVPEESIGTRTPGRLDAEYAGQIAAVSPQPAPHPAYLTREHEEHTLTRQSNGRHSNSIQ
jgi:cobyrinic acid a,c-diamide synthase